MLPILTSCLLLALPLVGAQQGGSSGGACSADSKCFEVQNDCAIANAYPFDRRTPVTCEQCVQLCNERLGAQPPYICKAAIYDAQWQSCDIFAVNGKEAPQKLVPYPSRNVYISTGACAGGAGANVTAPTNATPTANGTSDGSCPSGQEARLMAVKDFKLKGSDEKVLDNLSPEQCAQACLDGKTSTGEAVTCKSASYGPGQKCVLSKEAAQPLGQGTLEPAPGITYWDKRCFPSDLVKKCPATKPFARRPQSILVGYAEVVVDSPNIDDCASKCLDAKSKYGFECVSGMYFYQIPNQNCILNSESQSSKPDLAAAEKDDQVDYFELDCRSSRFFATRRSRAANNFKDLIRSVPDFGEWIRWGDCEESYLGERYRYRRCDENDIRLCERQSQRCPDYEAKEPRRKAYQFNLRKRLQYSRRSDIPVGGLFRPVSPVGSLTKEEERFQNAGEKAGQPLQPATSASPFRFNVCVAIRDANGNRKCGGKRNVGAKLLTDGRREFCFDPVDC